MKDIAVEYLGGSGFLVTIGETGFLFDASEHGPDRRILPDRDALLALDKLYVFVSHIHGDHFNPAVFSLAGKGRPVFYLLSFDIEGDKRVPEGLSVQFLKADQSYEIPGLGTVQTLRSTDEGVAFSVKTPTASL